MTRTNDTDVRKLITLTSVSDTASFIETANVMVDQNLLDSGLSDAVLEQIEKYLAAHLLAIHPDEKQVIEQTIGDAIDKYAGSFGKGLESTSFGQTVLLLDTTGTFAGLGTYSADISVITVDYD
jgi:hypothetical protein